MDTHTLKQLARWLHSLPERFLPLSPIGLLIVTGVIAIGTVVGVLAVHQSHTDIVTVSQTTSPIKSSAPATSSSSSASKPAVATSPTPSTTLPTHTSPVASAPSAASTPTPASNQATVDARMCSDEPTWAGQLNNEDTATTQDLSNYINQNESAYNSGNETAAEAVSLINQSVSGYNAIYTQSFNNYMSPVRQYGCTPSVTAPLQATQCAAISDCWASLPS
jgi:cytoskeletal protein RodZ